MNKHQRRSYKRVSMHSSADPAPKNRSNQTNNVAHFERQVHNKRSERSGANCTTNVINLRLISVVNCGRPKSGARENSTDCNPTLSRTVEQRHSISTTTSHRHQVHIHEQIRTLHFFSVRDVQASSSCFGVAKLFPSKT